MKIFTLCIMLVASALASPHFQRADWNATDVVVPSGTGAASSGFAASTANPLVAHLKGRSEVRANSSLALSSSSVLNSTLANSTSSIGLVSATETSNATTTVPRVLVARTPVAPSQNSTAANSTVAVGLVNAAETIGSTAVAASMLVARTPVAVGVNSTAAPFPFTNTIAVQAASVITAAAASGTVVRRAPISAGSVGTVSASAVHLG